VPATDKESVVPLSFPSFATNAFAESIAEEGVGWVEETTGSFAEPVDVGDKKKIWMVPAWTGIEEAVLVSTIIVAVLAEGLILGTWAFGAVVGEH
jgi:hypothetical protein